MFATLLIICIKMEAKCIHLMFSEHEFTFLYICDDYGLVKSYYWQILLNSIIFWLTLLISLIFWLILLISLIFWLILLISCIFWLILLISLIFWVDSAYLPSFFVWTWLSPFSISVFTHYFFLCCFIVYKVK